MQDLITLIAVILSSMMFLWYRIGRLDQKIKNSDKKFKRLDGKFRYLYRRINDLEHHIKKEE